MSSTKLNVSIIEYTPNPEQIVALAARMCYSKCNINELKEKVSKTDQSTLIKKIMDMGHLTPIEHISFTFAVEGVSRALLAQITRHRIATFCVKSQRYVDAYSNNNSTFNYIIPPSIKKLGKKYVKIFEDQMREIQKFYNFWFEKLSQNGKTKEQASEDARFVLPNACETKFIFTMNARELLHFFSLRLCKCAQWEIRNLATKMHKLLLKIAPQIFSYAGPPCKFGVCREGYRCQKDSTQ